MYRINAKTKYYNNKHKKMTKMYDVLKIDYRWDRVKMESGTYLCKIYIYKLLQYILYNML